MEEGETPEECCVREIEEETGKIVRPLYQFLKINEYYEDWRYIDDYFVCELVGEGQMKLTEAEIRRDVKPEWIPLEDAIEIFSKHQDYAETEEEKRGAFFREYTALQEYMKVVTP